MSTPLKSKGLAWTMERSREDTGRKAAAIQCARGVCSIVGSVFRVAVSAEVEDLCLPRILSSVHASSKFSPSSSLPNKANYW